MSRMRKEQAELQETLSTLSRELQIRNERLVTIRSRADAETYRSRQLVSARDSALRELSVMRTEIQQLRDRALRAEGETKEANKEIRVSREKVESMAIGHQRVVNDLKSAHRGFLREKSVLEENLRKAEALHRDTQTSKRACETRLETVQSQLEAITRELESQHKYSAEHRSKLTNLEAISIAVLSAVAANLREISDAGAETHLSGRIAGSVVLPPDLGLYPELEGAVDRLVVATRILGVALAKAREEATAAKCRALQADRATAKANAEAAHEMETVKILRKSLADGKRQFQERLLKVKKELSDVSAEGKAQRAQHKAQLEVLKEKASKEFDTLRRESKTAQKRYRTLINEQTERTEAAEGKVLKFERKVEDLTARVADSEPHCQHLERCCRLLLRSYVPLASRAFELSAQKALLLRMQNTIIRKLHSLHPDPNFKKNKKSTPSFRSAALAVVAANRWRELGRRKATFGMYLGGEGPSGWPGVALIDSENLPGISKPLPRLPRPNESDEIAAGRIFSLLGQTSQSGVGWPLYRRKPLARRGGKSRAMTKKRREKGKKKVTGVVDSLRELIENESEGRANAEETLEKERGAREKAEEKAAAMIEHAENMKKKLKKATEEALALRKIQLESVPSSDHNHVLSIVRTLSDDISILQAKLKRSVEDKEKRQQHITSIETKAIRASKRASKLEQDSKQISLRLESKDRALGLLQEKAESLSAQLGAALAEVEAFKSKSLVTASEKDRLQFDLEGSSRRIENYEEQISTLKDKLQGTEKKWKKAQAEANSFAETARQEEAHARKLKATCEELKDDIRGKAIDLARFRRMLRAIQNHPPSIPLPSPHLPCPSRSCRLTSRPTGNNNLAPSINRTTDSGRGLLDVSGEGANKRSRSRARETRRTINVSGRHSHLEHLGARQGLREASRMLSESLAESLDAEGSIMFAE
ncbi:hypothetical protein AAMO2058_000868500 [Amorphochlora amoebiformis]